MNPDLNNDYRRIFGYEEKIITETREQEERGDMRTNKRREA